MEISQSSGCALVASAACPQIHCALTSARWDGDRVAAMWGMLVPSCGELVTKALCCGAAGAFSA